MSYNAIELMICCASRALEDGKTVAVGTGMPCAAAMLDFLTTPGYLTGRGAREAAGLPANSGPYRVITDLAVLGYHPQNMRMQVRSLHEGVTLDQVRQATSFELEAAEALTTTPAPT